ncbi:putative metalloprotease CJM1_0395 family protein [Shewanella colwelliana]|nr:putative metalloprotease CJM1_0395 family protein [Shewanella colwelliana]
MNGVISAPSSSVNQATVSPISVVKSSTSFSPSQTATVSSPKGKAVAAPLSTPISVASLSTAETGGFTSPEITSVQSDIGSTSFSLSQGPMSLAGLINSVASGASQAEPSPSQSISPNANGVGQSPQTDVQLTPTDKDFEPIFDNQEAADKDTNAAQATQDYSPFDEEQDTDRNSDSQASDRAEALRQQIELDTLAKRDAEVKAHEQAHANVGGNFARSPSFKYEQGSDGKRYAVDGEVAIDISVVSGDPLATVNKMKQVYAAAMAPAQPSMADIRVASEALRKMNEAKSQLAIERQEKAVTVADMAPLIGAENAIKGVVFPEPIQTKIAGKVDGNGRISASRVDSPSGLDDNRSPSRSIEHISRQILASSPAEQSNHYQDHAISGMYQSQSQISTSNAIDFTV